MGIIDNEYLNNVTENNESKDMFDNISKILENVDFSMSNTCLERCFVDQYGTFVLKIYGGLNGPGKWTDYFKDFIKMIDVLEEKFYHTWIIQIDNDPIDDVFTMYLGIKIIR